MTINPYAPPQRDSRSAFDPSLPWYYVDFVSATYHELWWCSPNVLAYSVLCLRKILSWRARPSIAFTHGQDLYLSSDQVSDDARRKMQPIVEAALALGFRVRAIRTMPHIGNANVFIAELVSSDGRVYLPVYYTRVWNRSVVQEVVVYCLFSQLVDERILLTLSRRQQIELPPQIEVAQFPRATPAQALAEHIQRLASVDIPVRLLDDEPALQQFIATYDRLVADFQINRGFYSPVSPADVDRLMAVPNQPGFRMRYVVFQVIGLLWLLFVAGFLFLLIAGGQFQWRTALPMIIAVVVIFGSLAYSWIKRLLGR